MKFFPSIQAGYAWLYKLVVNAVAISGGTIDASTIGGTTPAAGTFTTLASNASIGIAGTTGGLVRRFSEQTVTLAGASGSILVNVPAGTRILATQLRVDTLITSGDGGASWKADFVNTPTTAICTGQAFAKNTKFNAIHPAYEITTGVVTITITPDAGTFSAGAIRAIVYFEDITAMADAA